MKRICLVFFLFCSFVLNGCAYTNIRNPLDTTLESTELGAKVGEASNYSVLWLFAWGDASYARAAQNGKISIMKHADREYKQYFFGAYVKQTTIVYGD